MLQGLSHPHRINITHPADRLRDVSCAREVVLFLAAIDLLLRSATPSYRSYSPGAPTAFGAMFLPSLPVGAPADPTATILAEGYIARPGT
jgi:hypothetical protein